MHNVTLYTHQDCQKHQLWPGFHEKSQRVEVLVDQLRREHGHMPWLRTPELGALPVRQTLEKIHDLSYVHKIENVSLMTPLCAAAAQLRDPRLQWYTRISTGSYQAAYAAAGTTMRAVSDVWNKATERAFVAVRPPGHHAGPNRAEGFCIFNNVAAGAVYARQLGFERVAIIDFDRHHGNGTQAIVERQKDPGLMFISTFQQGCKYDQNRAEHFATHGWITDRLFAFPIPQQADYRHVSMIYEKAVAPRLADFRPDLVMFSAGFDMHEADPLSSLHLKSQDYQSLTRLVTDAADSGQRVKVVSVLEGGYDPKSLAESAAYHVTALRGP